MCNPQKTTPNNIKGSEKDNAENQDTIAAETIGGYPGGIGGESVCDIHHDHHGGYERDRQTDIFANAAPGMPR
jgi:hypothetical protein